MIKFFRKLCFKIRLHFAKKHIGIDFGHDPDKTTWCVTKCLDGKVFMVDSGFGKPPFKVLKGGQIYIDQQAKGCHW